MKEADIIAGDELDALMDRECILLAGAPGSGKSDTIVRLALDLQDTGNSLVVIDRDRGVAKAVKEICGGAKPENMTYFLAKTWQRVDDGITFAFQNLTVGDWLCFDMLGSFWDFAQNEYARMVYGEELTRHVLLKRADAELEIQQAIASGKTVPDTGPGGKAAIRAQAVGYSGLEGRTDWSLIKRMHNDEVVEKAILHGEFNVLATTSLTPIDNDAAHKWPLFKVAQKRPEGEKHNIHRFDTIVFAAREKEGFLWRTDLGGGIGKDRGRQLYRDVPYDDIGFVASYLAQHHEG